MNKQSEMIKIWHRLIIILYCLMKANNQTLEMHLKCESTQNQNEKKNKFRQIFH